MIILIFFIVSLALAITGITGMFFIKTKTNQKEYFAFSIGGIGLVVVSLIYML